MAISVISPSLSGIAEWASLSATSVSVSVVEIATANVTDRVTERIRGKRTLTVTV